jgi:hypothetical protein
LEEGNMTLSPRVLRYAVFAMMAMVLVVIGCSDEFYPTRGTLHIEIDSSSPDIMQGARVYLNGVRILEPIQDGTVELQLEPGDYRIQPVPADTCVSPDPSLITVTVRAGYSTASSFTFLVDSGVTVTSNLEGAPILLDGKPTGKVTPATLGCVEPGSRRVELDLNCGESHGADVVVVEDSSHAVEILVPTLEVQGNVAGLEILVDGEETGSRVPAHLPCVSPGPHTVSVAIRGEIVMGEEPQQIKVDIPRPTVLEVVGFVFCSNCPLADEATETLVHEPEFQDNIYRLEIHLDTGGGLPDIFGNKETMTRYTHYTFQDQRVPLMVFNGAEHIRGAEEFESLLQELREKSRAEMENNETSWHIELRDFEEIEPYNPDEEGGEVYRVTARVLVVGELEDTNPVLYGFAYKTDIDHKNLSHPEQTKFYDVVRTIVGPLPLGEPPYDLARVGDEVLIPLEFSYPTGEKFGTTDSQPPHFDGYGIVVTIQSSEAFEPTYNSKIYQAARITWD